jgi:hypothetical protein
VFFQRINFVKISIREVLKGLFYHDNGLVQASEKYLPRHILECKFRVSFTNITGMAQYGSNKMMQIAYQMQTEVARRIMYARANFPNGSLLSILKEFLLYSEQVTFEEFE